MAEVSSGDHQAVDGRGVRPSPVRQPGSGVTGRYDHDRWPNATAVGTYLESGEGSQTVHQVITRLRLPMSIADDLRAQVVNAALKVDLAGETIDNTGAWTRTVLQNRATDLLRGLVRRRRRLTPASNPTSTESAHGSDTPTVEIPVDDPGLDAVTAGAYELAMRQRLCDGAVQIGPRRIEPWELSATMTYLAVCSHGLAESDGRITVRADRARYRHALHVGLWFAGERECFQVGDPPSARTRRKRRCADVERVLSELRRLAQEEE